MRCFTVTLLLLATVLILIVNVSAESSEKDWYLHLANSTRVQIVAQDAQDVQEIATLEVVFKANNCTLQGLLTQKYYIEGHNQKNKEDSNLRGVVSSEVNSNNNFYNDIQYPVFHGRGIAISSDGRIVTWSRDTYGRWIGIDAGPCIANKWTHVALIQDRSDISAYRDGNVVNHTAIIGHKGGEYLPLFTLGTFSDGYAAENYFYEGYIAACRVWSVVRSEEELSNGEVAVAENSKGLVLSYKMMNKDSAPIFDVTSDSSVTTRIDLNVEGVLGKLVLTDKYLSSTEDAAANKKNTPAKTDSFDFKSVGSEVLIQDGGQTNDDVKSLEIPEGVISVTSVATPVNSARETTQLFDETQEKEDDVEESLLPEKEDGDVTSSAPAPLECPNDCHGHGECNVDTGVCACLPGPYLKESNCEMVYQGFMLNLKGNGGLQLPPMGKYDDLSIGLWLKLENNNENTIPNVFGLILPEDASVRGALTVRFENNILSVGVKGNSPDSMPFSGAEIPIKKWTFVLVTYSVGTATANLYLDGVWATSISFMSAVSLFIGSSFIRALPGDMNNALNANIDELQLWSYILTEGDAKGLLSSHRSGRELGLISLYNFDESDRDIAFDKAVGTKSEIDHGSTMKYDALLLSGAMKEFSDAEFLPCGTECGKHGTCSNGKCKCFLGYGGSTCTEFTGTCATGCSGRGSCVEGKCSCEPGFTGDTCAWAPTCKNFCSGRGMCMDEVCVCEKLFTGDDCSLRRCPRMCNGHGKCTLHGCVCKTGWGGEDCSSNQMFPLTCVTIMSSDTQTTSTSCTRLSKPSKIELIRISEEK